MVAQSQRHKKRHIRTDVQVSWEKEREKDISSEGKKKVRWIEVDGESENKKIGRVCVWERERGERREREERERGEREESDVRQESIGAPTELQFLFFAQANFLFTTFLLLGLFVPFMIRGWMIQDKYVHKLLLHHSPDYKKHLRLWSLRSIVFQGFLFQMNNSISIDKINLQYRMPNILIRAMVVAQR